MAKVLSLLLAIASAISTAKTITQVHLALTNQALDCGHGVSVSFASDTQAPFKVSYGTANAILNTVSTTSSSYTVATYTSPFLHSVKLCGLTPATKYSYNVDDLFSSSFVSPPGPTDGATVIGFVGDIDLKVDSTHQLLTPVQNLATQALVIVGGYSYADGNHKKWDQWFQLQQPIFSKLPIAGINGNHEVV